MHPLTEGDSERERERGVFIGSTNRIDPKESPRRRRCRRRPSDVTAANYSFCACVRACVCIYMYIPIIQFLSSKLPQYPLANYPGEKCLGHRLPSCGPPVNKWQFTGHQYQIPLVWATRNRYPCMAHQCQIPATLAHQVARSRHLLQHNSKLI